MHTVRGDPLLVIVTGLQDISWVKLYCGREVLVRFLLELETVCLGLGLR